VPVVQASKPPFGEDWFRKLVESFQAAVFVYARGKIVYVNSEAVRLCGADAEEILKLRPIELVHPEDREAFVQQEKRLRHSALPGALAMRLLRPDGQTRWVIFSVTTIERDGRQVAVGSAMDITRRVEAERQLRESREWLEMAQWAGRSVAWEWNPATDAMLLSGSASEIYGVPEERVPRTGTEMRAMIPPDDRTVLDEAVVESAATGRPFSIEHRLIVSQEDHRWISVRGQAFRGPDGQIERVFGVSADVTDQRRAEAERAYLASHDHLTGLLNRREFERRLEQSLRSARNGTVMHTLCYLDLDDFKVVNDTCGHEAGDRLLGELAATLRENTPVHDVLGRLGGDEFGCIFHDCPPREAERRAQRLLDAVSSFRFSWQGKVFRIGASIGLVSIDAGAGNTNDVLGLADGACYVAKAHGRNKIHCSDAGDYEVEQRHLRSHWIQRLNVALEEDNFRLFFQPIVPLDATRNPPMREILLRLQDQSRSLIEPGEFLPAAEHSRLMPQIDTWVVRHALPLISTLERSSSGGDFVYTINLSGQSLGSVTFMEELQDLLSRTGIPTQRICFEVTETAAISNLDAARHFMEAIRDLGYRFILDDFGSGLSSFGYLRSLPVEFLKIDGSLVSGVGDDDVLREMVQAVHRIGRTMQMKTIAESVENEAIFTALRDIEVDYCQGYWTGRPRPFPPG